MVFFPIGWLIYVNQSILPTFQPLSNDALSLSVFCNSGVVCTMPDALDRSPVWPRSVVSLSTPPGQGLTQPTILTSALCAYGLMLAFNSVQTFIMSVMCPFSHLSIHLSTSTRPFLL